VNSTEVKFTLESRGRYYILYDYPSGT